MEQILENRMVVDSEWDHNDLDGQELPRCECCEERIRQFRALRILNGRRRIWMCDRCIEDMKEVTGW